MTVFPFPPDFPGLSVPCAVFFNQQIGGFLLSVKIPPVCGFI